MEYMDEFHALMEKIELERQLTEDQRQRCETELACIHGSLKGCIAILANAKKDNKDMVDDYIAMKIAFTMDCLRALVSDIEKIEPYLKRSE